MKKMKVFLGPCMLESWDLSAKVAHYLVTELKPFENKIDVYFKGSFDKANRTSFESYRGPGLEEGLKILARIKKDFGLKTLTDYHLPEQAEEVAKIVDVLQVPAFLCRQSDIVFAGAQACQKYNRILKIKKGQFLAPQDTQNIVAKASQFLKPEQILLTERGTSFGYNTLVVDMASFEIMKSFGVEAIHDATHCVQRPGGQGKTSGGNRDFIEPLAKAAIAAGASGLFMEIHPSPSEALSDSATQWPMEKTKELLEKLIRIKEACDA